MGEVHPQLWWYLARGSGIVAWVLSVLAVLLGLALATRALGNKPRPAWLLDLHRMVGGLTILFVAFHLGSLVADSYVTFGVADLLLPMASNWRPGPVAWGVGAMWLLAAVEVSSLFMRRLSRKTWRAIHLMSYLACVMATVHMFAAGTDATNRLLAGSVVAVAGVTGFFVVYRILMPKRRQARARAQARQPRPTPEEEPVPVAG